MTTNSTATLAAMSTRVSSDPGAGHYYWSYRALIDYWPIQKSPPIIGPVGQEPSFVTGVFRNNSKRYEFRFGLSALFSLRPIKLVKELRRRLGEGCTHFYSYDGGLTELLLCHLASLAQPNLTMIFNFHWADQWLEILDSSRLTNRALRQALKWLAQTKPNNVVYSAETRVFGLKLEDILEIELATFPISASISPTIHEPWPERKIDVLVMPQRTSELDFVHELVTAMEADRRKCAIAVKEAVWSRWPQSKSFSGMGEVIFLPLDEASFASLLSDARVVILPYDKPYFRWGSSSKFNEAIAFGCFPFAPSWTAIPSQARVNSEAHAIDSASPRAAAFKILKRLDDGPGESQPALFVQDLVEWALNISDREKAGPAPKLSDFLRFFWVGMVAAAYRPRVQFGPLRQKIGTYVDRAKASIRQFGHPTRAPSSP